MKLVDQSWRERANCRPPEHLKGEEKIEHIREMYKIFFPQQGDSIRKAKAYCEPCEVRAQCIEFALYTSQHIGYYGCPDRPRRRARRQRTKAKGSGIPPNPELMDQILEESGLTIVSIRLNNDEDYDDEEITEEE